MNLFVEMSKSVKSEFQPRFSDRFLTKLLLKSFNSVRLGLDAKLSGTSHSRKLSLR